MSSLRVLGWANTIDKYNAPSGQHLVMVGEDDSTRFACDSKSVHFDSHARDLDKKRCAACRVVAKRFDY